MKILAVSGEHLASLDRFELRFDRPPLGAAGLFVIFGPTGAGKSTLLDAMCLALYDRTPRLGHGKGPLSLLQRGAVHASAAVEFRDGQGRRYQARWHIHRARRRLSGDWQEAQVELISLDSGESLGSHRKTETLELIRQKLGLGFDQFCRSVLLAQGQFARFLHETGDERARLLETITGGEIYSQLSRQAFLSHKAAAETLSDKLRQLALLPQLTDQARDKLRDEEMTLVSRREILGRGEQAAKALLDFERERTARAAEVEQAEAAVAAAVQAAADAEELRRELSRVERAETVRAPLQALADAQVAAARAREALEHAVATAEKAARLAEMAEAAAARAAQAAQDAGARLTAAQPLFATAAGLEQKLKAMEGERLAAAEAQAVTRREHGEKARARTGHGRERERLEREEQQLDADLRVARAAADLVARRAELLVEGQPCPLCGSLVHPLAGHDGPPLLARLEQQRAATATLRRAAAEAERLAVLAEQECHARLSAATERVERLSREHTSGEGELLSLLGALNLPDLRDGSARPLADGAPARPREVAELIRRVTEAQEGCERARAEAQAALVGRKEAAAAATAAAEARRQQLADSEAARERLIHVVDGALAEADFTDVGTVERLLAPARPARDAQRQRLAAIDKAVVETGSQLADRRQRLSRLDETTAPATRAAWQADIAAAEKLLPATGSADGRTAAMLLALTTAAKEAAERLYQLTLELAADERHRTERQALAAELAAQRELVDEWAALSELIGSADGKKFRIFAQGLTLDTLLGHANRHLRRLRPRYSLRRRNERMELEMVDHDMADEARDCATLSGGETFLVSLALALGLSSLSARNVRVESLFIDEGFGSLDRDALDGALAVLEDLQASGQTIGVISHVGELAERVPYRVRVEPRRPGKCSVTVLGPDGLVPALEQALGARSPASTSGQASLFPDGEAHA